MKPQSTTNQQSNQPTFTVEGLAQFQASLLPELPDDLLKGFAACDRRRLMKQTESSNQEEREAAWGVLFLITERLEEVFPSKPVTGPVQYSYYEV
jgi:hypothetical protein